MRNGVNQCKFLKSTRRAFSPAPASFVARSSMGQLAFDSCHPIVPSGSFDSSGSGAGSWGDADGTSSNVDLVSRGSDSSCVAMRDVERSPSRHASMKCQVDLCCELTIPRPVKVDVSQECD